MQYVTTLVGRLSTHEYILVTCGQLANMLNVGHHMQRPLAAGSSTLVGFVYNKSTICSLSNNKLNKLVS